MKYLFAILISFFILGCAKNENLEPKQNTQNTVKEDKPLVQANTPKKPEKLILPNSIYSSFHTILPCPNCEGIKTIITLNKDKTYTKTMLTMDKEVSLVEKNGTFDVDDSAIILKDENGKFICEMVDGGQVKTNLKMQTSLKGLFVAGDIREDAPKQVIVAAGDGAVAALSAMSYIESLH